MMDQPVSSSPVKLEVGRIQRPHGLKGEVVVSFTSSRFERLERGSIFQTDKGPLTVVDSRPHSKRFLVRFGEIFDRTTAEDWRNTVLLAEFTKDPSDETLWVHELVGAVVIDQHGIERGVVRAVVDNPASDLLELDDGNLVPLTFVIGLQPNERVDVDVPDGLFVTQ